MSPLNDQPTYPILFSANREPQKTASGGFTLLEVLVTVVVISLGLLGLAGLQVVSLNNNQTAYYRSLATQQANDMMDRMRANLAGVGAGNYDNLTTAIPANPACFSAGCSVANTTVTDHFQWLTNTAAVLPQGAGTVRCVQGPAITCQTLVATSNRIFNVTISWAARTEAGNVTQSFVTRFAP
jgi:type IV pilus assembly protein PilV